MSARRKRANCRPDRRANAASRSLGAAGLTFVVIAVMGLSPRMEGEEGERNCQGDKTDLAMPPVQDDLLKALVATGKPVVLVLTGRRGN